MADSIRDESAGRDAQAVLVPLAEGFEEIEAVTIIDVLRRGGVEVCVAGLTPALAGGQPAPVTGAHGLSITPDVPLADVDIDTLAMVVLPGGMPGTTNLVEDERVLEIVRRLESSGGTVAAICAAPLVLSAAGVLEGRTVTAYPSVRGELRGATVLGEPSVVRSGPLVTSQGVGTALEFALELVSQLRGPARAQELRTAMLVPSQAR
jgi:4-methyl-5(b-hydroxyethyl)-thiazole monophosphate biosynthesis